MYVLLIMLALLQSDLLVHNKMYNICKWYWIVYISQMFIPFNIILKKQFSLGTDDDHRVVLESISDGVDCEHDYINATYVDVRSSSKNMYMAVEKSVR